MKPGLARAVAPLCSGCAVVHSWYEQGGTSPTFSPNAPAPDLAQQPGHTKELGEDTGRATTPPPPPPPPPQHPCHWAFVRYSPFVTNPKWPVLVNSPEDPVQGG